MKTFTYRDIQVVSDVLKKYPDFKKIVINDKDSDLLFSEFKGPVRTRTGYGSKLPTQYKINYNSRLYRVYCRIYSNNGTCYFIANNQEIVVQ